MENNDFYYTFWRKKREIKLKEVSQAIGVAISSISRFERKKQINKDAYAFIKKKYDEFIKQYEMSEGNAQ
ncbi:MAG TPA: helix-turn-helix transcriptional regulator [Peptococcaceae bacterium]|nr:helix-turn-helix transcriptional regulator [Peptococcaceae bacterium]